MGWVGWWAGFVWLGDFVLTGWVRLVELGGLVGWVCLVSRLTGWVRLVGLGGSVSWVCLVRCFG